jgi:hypothetical protein
LTEIENLKQQKMMADQKELARLRANYDRIRTAASALPHSSIVHPYLINLSRKLNSPESIDQLPAIREDLDTISQTIHTHLELHALSTQLSTVTTLIPSLPSPHPILSTISTLLSVLYSPLQSIQSIRQQITALYTTSNINTSRQAEG